MEQANFYIRRDVARESAAEIDALQTALTDIDSFKPLLVTPHITMLDSRVGGTDPQKWAHSVIYPAPETAKTVITLCTTRVACRPTDKDQLAVAIMLDPETSQTYCDERTLYLRRVVEYTGRTVIDHGPGVILGYVATPFAAATAKNRLSEIPSDISFGWIKVRPKLRPPRARARQAQRQFFNSLNAQ